MTIEIIAFVFAGFPKLGYPEIEPVTIDDINVVLDEKPGGYKAHFSNIRAVGVVGLEVTKVEAMFKDDSAMFQLSVKLPTVKVKAKYESSGKLLMMESSSSGDYYGNYGKLYMNSLSTTAPGAPRGALICNDC